MNQGDTVQIEAPDFDPDIDRVSSPSTDGIPNKLLIQGTSSPTPAITEPENECPTPATSVQQSTSQDTDWPDAIPVQIPSLIDQSEDQGLDRHQAQLKELKFLIWRRILKKSSLPIWTCTWHTITHTKPANISIKNIDPTCTP